MTLLDLFAIQNLTQLLDYLCTLLLTSQSTLDSLFTNLKINFIQLNKQDKTKQNKSHTEIHDNELLNQNNK